MLNIISGLNARSRRLYWRYSTIFLPHLHTLLTRTGGLSFKKYGFGNDDSNDFASVQGLSQDAADVAAAVFVKLVITFILFLRLLLLPLNSRWRVTNVSSSTSYHVYQPQI